jgi:predicted amidohydrolase
VRTYYYSKGIQLYFAPNADDHPRWESTMTHIAIEGRCHVFAACQYAQQKDYPSDHELPPGHARNPEDVLFAGGSMIISPLGQILAGPLRSQEGVLTTEIDLDEQLMGKFDLDSVGHYSRRDSEFTRQATFLSLTIPSSLRAKGSWHS